MKKLLIIGLCTALVLGGCASSNVIGGADKTTSLYVTSSAEDTQAAVDTTAAAGEESTSTVSTQSLDKDDTSTVSTVPLEATGFSVTYRGTVIALGADMTPVVEALGEPTSYTEETSCAFEGLDKTYYYGSLYVQTNPSEEGDRIGSIWFADDGVTTDEGVYIGATKEEVEAAYGAENFTDDTTCQLDRDGQRLLVLLKDGAVSSIQYNLITG